LKSKAGRCTNYRWLARIGLAARGHRLGIVLNYLFIHFLPTVLPPLSLYIHIPWCIKKCPYCDFNSHAAKADLPETAYIDALLADLAKDLRHYEICRPIATIFIGGGTPSLFSAAAIDRLLQGIAQQVTLEKNVEITLEANPGTFESRKFKDFRSLGINRLSIGIQSLHEEQLQRLGRVHSSGEAIAAVEIAHQAGFDNINLDLMFGLPEATLDTSISDLETAIRLQPTHISLYQLTLEPNTYFHKFPPKLPGDELIFETQRICQSILASQGYRQYEISAYSLEGRQCRHNLNYWQFGDYLGIGAGAHGKISLALPSRIIRTVKPRNPEQYLKNTGNEVSETMIDTQDLPLEFVMNHLRLKQGFTASAFQSATGLTLDALEPGLSSNLKQQLLVEENGLYYCSDWGWNFLDTILQQFIS
jgi:putative oxygen-independent coproporphyrinogen III oxidase